MEVLEQVHDRVAVLGVEVARRFVGEQHGRIAGQRAGDGDPLLLAAGELRGKMLGAVGHADFFERLVDPLFTLGGGHAAVGQRKVHVFINRQVADQVE